MAARKKNPLDDVAKTVGNWLGGAARAYADITDRSRDVQPGRAARVQAALDATRAIGKVVDIATGGVGSSVVSDAQRMAKTGSSTPSALYKTAAVNLAAGVGGAKAAQVAGRAVAATGIPARVANRVRGEIVGLHGSPVKGLKQIEPRKGTYAPKNAQPLAYAANPKFREAVSDAEDYAMGYSAPVRPTERGSIYVTKAKKSAVVKPESGAPISSSPIFASREPMNVIAEVSMYDLNRQQNLAKILKRAGVKVPKRK